MEKEGILIDKGTLKALSIEFQDKLTQFKRKFMNYVVRNLILLHQSS